MKCCKECQWYLDDSCFGHYLICTPFLFVDSVDAENQCEAFENKKRNMSREELIEEWFQ